MLCVNISFISSYIAEGERVWWLITDTSSLIRLGDNRESLKWKGLTSTGANYTKQTSQQKGNSAWKSAELNSHGKRKKAKEKQGELRNRQREEFAWEENEGRYVRLPVTLRRLIAPCHRIKLQQILHHIPNVPSLNRSHDQRMLSTASNLWQFASSLAWREGPKEAIEVKRKRGVALRRDTEGNENWPEGKLFSGPPWVGRFTGALITGQQPDQWERSHRWCAASLTVGLTDCKARNLWHVWLFTQQTMFLSLWRYCSLHWLTHLQGYSICWAMKCGYGGKEEENRQKTRSKLVLAWESFAFLTRMKVKLDCGAFNINVNIKPFPFERLFSGNTCWKHGVWQFF